MKANFNAACNSENAEGEGWGYAAVNTAAPGKKHIHLCKQTCTKYRDTLTLAAAFGVSINKPSLPVPIYAYKTVCTQ